MNNVVNELWLTKAKELYNIQQQRKELEKKESVLKEVLKQLTNNEPMYYGGFNYDYIIKPGFIAYDLIPQLQGVDLEMYRKSPIQVWTLKLMQV